MKNLRAKGLKGRVQVKENAEDGVKKILWKLIVKGDYIDSYLPQILKKGLSTDGELINVVRRKDWMMLWTRVIEMKLNSTL